MVEGEEEKKDRKKIEILGVDGKLIFFMTKLGHIIILNIIWLLTCIPVFTIGTATTSLYYSMVKNVRHDRGYPVAEYFRSFKRTFASGSLITVCIAIWLFALYHLRTIALSYGTDTDIFLSRMYVTLMIVTACILLYLFPVLSRFDMKISSMLKLSFVMTFRYIGFTVIIMGLSAFMIWLYIFYLPIPVILFLPGIWCYVCTYMMEKVLRKYMTKTENDEDAWYFE